MGKRITLLCLVLTLSLMVVPVNAWEFGLGEVFCLGAANGILSTMEYNSTLKELTIGISARNDSWFNIGLTCLEIAFNKSYAPPANPNSITAFLVVDNVTYYLVDMIKNVTFVQDAVIVNWGDNTTRECFYLGAYIYLFENKTVIAEGSMKAYTAWGKTIFHEGEVPETEPIITRPVPSQSKTLASDASTKGTIVVIVSYGDEPTTPDDNLLVITGSVGLVVMAIVIVVWYGRRQ